MAKKCFAAGAAAVEVETVDLMDDSAVDTLCAEQLKASHCGSDACRIHRKCAQSCAASAATTRGARPCAMTVHNVLCGGSTQRHGTIDVLVNDAGVASWTGQGPTNGVLARREDAAVQEDRLRGVP